MSRLTDSLIQALDPVELWRAAMGVEADPWQQQVLRAPEKRIILNVSRQGGKSSVVACKALHTAMFEPRSLVLLVSRSLRQSSELMRKVSDAYQVLGKPVSAEAETKLVLELETGSRIAALPGGDEGSLRGFSGVRLLIIDEASRCSDALWIACRPMVAVSGGAIILLSTPYGRRGFFHQIWTEAQHWLKIEVNAERIPRLSPAFLASELAELGPIWFGQEYGCQFVQTEDSLFQYETVMGMVDPTIKPLFNADGMLIEENL